MAQMVKNLPAKHAIWVRSLGQKGNSKPLQYSFLENPHGQRSLVGYSLWGRKDLDMTERLHFTSLGTANTPTYGYFYLFQQFS